MPTDDNGQDPAADDSGTKSGQNGDAAGKNANGSDKGKGGKGSDDDGGDAGDKPKPITFESQEALDRMIQKRIERATKDSEAKAKLSKEQLLEKERDDARAEVRERDLRDDFNAAATAAGLDGSKSSKIFKMYRDDIDTDDNGKPTNIKDVIKAIKADFPELFKPGVKPGGGDGGSGNGNNGKAVDGDMNNVLRRMSGRG